jgi:hypothetical protein
MAKSGRYGDRSRATLTQKCCTVPRDHRPAHQGIKQVIEGRKGKFFSSFYAQGCRARDWLAWSPGQPVALEEENIRGVLVLAYRPAETLRESKEREKTVKRTCIAKGENTMTPLYTLLMCLPAALVLIACVSGLAGLSPPATQRVDHPRVGKRCSKSHSA